MDLYIDVHIRTDPEFSPAQVMSVLFRKLHTALLVLENQNVGVSFPEYSNKGLGRLLRLHGTNDALQKLMDQKWLTGVSDQVSISSISPVPSGVKYRIVQRVQAKSNPERLRRRAIKRHGISQVQAEQKIPNSAAEALDLPFVNMLSTSSQMAFPLFVRHGQLTDDPVEGSFSSYGFSAKATVPWF